MALTSRESLMNTAWETVRFAAVQDNSILVTTAAGPMLFEFISNPEAEEAFRTWLSDARRSGTFRAGDA